MDKNKFYNVMLSGGKDSVATALLMLKYGYKFRLHYSFFYFDKSRNIPATLPEHHFFVVEKIIPYFENKGIRTIIHCPESDYITNFYKVKTRGKHIGDILGFPLPREHCCWCNSKLKFKNIDFVNTVMGIAYDEKERVNRLIDNINKFSLLNELEITEKECFDICKSENLLSPIYEHGQRDGCWFCNQQNISSSQYIKNNYPELIEELMRIEKDCKYAFARNYQSVSDFFNREYKRKKQ